MLDTTDVKTALPAVKNRVSAKGPCLNDFIAIARDAHLGVISAFSSAIDRAIACGRALIQMGDAGLARHGEWPRIYKRCGMSERQAQRYQQLARLVGQKPSSRTVLGDCTSIQAAIKKLSPSKPRANSGSRVAHQPASPAKKTSFADIVAAWMAAPNAERTRALDAIGWNALRGAIPASWHAVLSTPVIDVTPAPHSALPATSDDLSIPDFLNRKH